MRKVVVGTEGNQFVNHSDEPTTEGEFNDVLDENEGTFATRDIEIGEEITGRQKILLILPHSLPCDACAENYFAYPASQTHDWVEELYAEFCPERAEFENSLHSENRSR